MYGNSTEIIFAWEELKKFFLCKIAKCVFPHYQLIHFAWGITGSRSNTRDSIELTHFRRVFLLSILILQNGRRTTTGDL